MKHRARKRFGQNFLQDPIVIQQLVQAIAPKFEDDIVEIGPGMGALTLPLAERVKRLRAVEIDRDLHAYLSALPDLKPKLETLCEDALQVDFSQWSGPLRLVGNLPYNISTPLIMHLLSYVANIQDMHFMLQKEVVQRMVADPGSKAFGRLSVICQYYCSVECLFLVPSHCFNPQPNVESAVVRLRPYNVRPFPEVLRRSLEAMTAKGFSMRRKTLANNLKGWFSADSLRNLGVDPRLRPEQLSVDDWVKLALSPKDRRP